MKKTQVLGIILTALVLAAMVALLGNFSSYETFASAAENPQKEFHVVGYLDTSQPMVYDPVEDPNLFSFYAKDKKGEIKKVILHDSKPQDFEKSEQLVMIGKMSGDQFECGEILMKCPSKYQEAGGPQPDADGYISNTAEPNT